MATRLGKDDQSGAARRAGLRGILLAAAALLTPACKNFNLYTVEQDMQLGTQHYSAQMKDARTINSGPQWDQVRRVVDRLVAVAEPPGPFEWEVHLIDDPEMVNAWCLPGGKMAVYSGILPVTQSDAGLAAVMGHEIGHAIERHGTERVSQHELGGAILQGAAANYEFAAANAEVFALGAQLLLFLPFGRKDELEADRIGLWMMARAGYDPREAVDFWKRMAANSEGAPPEFLSTHPSDATRVAQLEKLLPRALILYEEAVGAAAP